MILHIQQQGAELRLSGSTLHVRGDGQERAVARIPLLEGLVLHGGVHLTAPVVTKLLSEGIDCVFLTVDGRYKGRLESLSSTAARLRALQALAASAPRIRLTLAKTIVANKLHAQERAWAALVRNSDAVQRALFSRLREQASGATSMAELQGIEGYASRQYFAGLRSLLPAEATSWTRARRPASDGLNALMNYGYAILESRVHAAVLTVGLDPHLGFLHQLGRPRPAFVLDMMEEFRSTLVDTTCWWLVREFSGEWWIPSSQGARLGEDARLRLIARLERRFGAMTLHQPTGQRVTIRRAIELQVRGFAALLQGGRRPFGPIRT